MTQNRNFRKTWLTLLSVSSILFLVIGVVMILIDKKYLHGSQYLITVAIYSVAIFQIYKNRATASNSMLNLGFIFSTIGLSNSLGLAGQTGLWGFGVIAFLAGLSKSYDNQQHKV